MVRMRTGDTEPAYQRAAFREEHFGTGSVWNNNKNMMKLLTLKVGVYTSFQVEVQNAAVYLITSMFTVLFIRIIKIIMILIPHLQAHMTHCRTITISTL